MLTLLGAWLAVGGAVAAVAGLAGLRRVRRLRREGVATWATTVPAPDAGNQPEAGAPDPLLLQYALPDGRLVERPAPGPSRKPGSPRPGQKLLIWYDPADPDDVLVYGRWGRASDRAFLVAGLLCVILGTAIAVG